MEEKKDMKERGDREREEQDEKRKKEGGGKEEGRNNNGSRSTSVTNPVEKNYSMLTCRAGGGEKGGGENTLAPQAIPARV